MSVSVSVSVGVAVAVCFLILVLLSAQSERFIRFLYARWKKKKLYLFQDKPKHNTGSNVTSL